MKKLFAILAAAVMVVVCASSCNKVAKTLADTEWTTTINEEGLVVTVTISFSKDGSFTMSQSAGSQSMTVKGSYSYTYPNVSCTFGFEGESTITVTGTVSSDYKTMTLGIDSDDAIVFTRTK